MSEKVLEKYGDIINMPHHESPRHPRMSMEQRAAQFAPFAALSGLDDVLAVTARESEEFAGSGRND